MSILFSHAPVNASFTVDESMPVTDDVQLDRELWHSLAGFQERICISIANPRDSGNNTIISWAVLCKKETCHGATVSPNWIQSHSPLPATVHIIRVEPILLSEIVVSALSSDAYDAATSNGGDVIKTWLAIKQRILAQGQVYSIPSDGEHNEYRVDMLEPVLQGYCQVGTTRFVVLLDAPPENISLGNGNADPHSNGEESGSSNSDDFEIDERFLAGSILVESNVGESSFSERNFTTQPLIRPPSVDVGTDLACTVYLRTADLAHIGVLNGDWVVARGANQRLVRILADDTIFHSPGYVAASPILLRNISPDTPSTFISIRPSPFGSRRPTIPTAKTLTIARIASPLSLDKNYQSRFLRALKQHFEGEPGNRRLVKLGDIIAVGIDTSRDSPDDSDATYPGTSTLTNEVVFFLITNVEHAILLAGSDTALDGVYAGSTLGEFGCWVDPDLTRVVQTGVEHVRIPDLGLYMRADPESPRAVFAALNAQGRPHVLRDDGPYGKLLALVAATLIPGAVDYNLSLSVMIEGARGIGKSSTAAWVAQRLGMHLLEINCYDLIGENDVKTEGTLRARFDKANSCAPCILLLRHIDALVQSTQAPEPGKPEPAIAAVLRECIDGFTETWQLGGHPVVIFATTSELVKVPPAISSCFKHEVAFEAPTEAERLEMLSALLVDYSLSPDVAISSLATQTAALVAIDLVNLVRRARAASIARAISSSNQDEVDVIHAGVPLTAADFNAAITQARASYSESIGAPKIPNVSWDDVGGLAHVKSDILDTIQLPLEHPELFADGLKKRSGILLYGPPGTGKTLLAKAVATSCSLNFFSIKGPELLNMYIGESEANVRRVFQRARDAKPCVIFFDELDSVAPKRGNHGDSGGVMDRIVSQLLAELDGMAGGSGGADVFVIGATNRPDLLDPALLRPGRFDRMLYLGVSDTHQAQQNILEALTRKFKLDPSLDLAALAERCPFNYTGADFYALCSDAMLNSMSRKAEELEAKIAKLNALPGPYEHPHPLTPQYYLAEMASQEDMAVLVSQEDFDRALQDLVPSVSQAEMDHYAHIQKRFSKDPSKDGEED